MRKIIVLPLLILVSFHYCLAQNDYLVPYRDGDKWGYSDTLARIVIPVQFDKAYRFFGGYGHVTTDKENAIIDKTGKIVLKGNFSIDNPYNGIASITTKKYIGLADVNKGKIILPPVYLYMNRNGDLAVMVDSTERQGLYNIALRKWLLPLKHDEIEIEDSTVTVTDKGTKVFYTVSKKGTLAKSATASGPQIVKDESPDGYVHVIPEAPLQEVMISGGSIHSGPFTAGGKVGYYSTIIENNKVVRSDTIAAIYESIQRLGTSLSLLMAKKDGKVGLLDVNGSIKIPFLYDTIMTTTRSDIDSIYIVTQNGR